MPLVTQRNRKWWTDVAMALTTLMMTIDFNGITAALPTIGRDLDTSTAGLQWTINAYLLALAAPSVAAGRLAGILWPSQGAAHRHLRIRDRLRGVWPGSNQLVVDLRPGCWRRLLARAHPNWAGDTMWALTTRASTQSSKFG